jgi:glycosyltransferase involved in cell wall biosynthesis
MSGKPIILLAAPTLAIHDAIGRDLLIGQRALTNAGFDVKVYAEHTPKTAIDGLVAKSEALKILARRDSILLYHMGVYWHLLPELFRACRGKVAIKYHNMTPPRFFQNYDLQSVAATKLGLDQVSWLMKSHLPDAMIGDSEFNLSDLRTIAGSNKLTKSGHQVSVIAPFVSVDDLQDKADDQALVSITKKSKLNVLFVGRVVPNKGHPHLLATIKSYEQLYGPDIQLIICGGLSPGFKKYKEDLLKLSELGQISAKVIFVHDADGRKLGTLYRHCQAFICMSEHEGFCVPVIEAQMMGLPVIAWDQAAVANTAGQGGIILKNLNYDVFATAIHRIQSDAKLRQDLISLGHQNAQRFSEQKLANELVHFIQSLQI